MSNVVPIPGCGVELSEGEVVVRCYHITVLRSRILKKHKARGDIAVTNKRIIYQGKGKSSMILNEIPIESVSAVNTYMGSGFIIGNILLGIAFLIAAITSIIIIPVFIIGLIVSIGFFIKSYNRGYGLTIKSSDIKGIGVSLGQTNVTVGDSRGRGIGSSFFTALFSTTGQGAVLSVTAEPTQEALMLMNELGAMVLDLKIMGDRAISKWQNHQSGPVDTTILNAKITDVINVQGMKNMVGSAQAGMQRMDQQGGAPHQSASAYNMPFGMGQQMPPPGMSDMGGQMPPQGMPGMGGQMPPPGMSGMAPSPPAPGMAPETPLAPPPPPPPGSGSNNGGFFG